MLPLSRNTTYVPAAPIRSLDINDMQDMIVGASHGSIVIPIPAASWQPLAGGGGILGNGQWTFSADTTLVAPIPRVPIGTTLEQVVYGYNRAGAGTITCRTYKRNLVAGTIAAGLGLIPAGDATGAEWETFTETLDYAIEADNAVWLEAHCDNAANIFGGALVTINFQ